MSEQQPKLHKYFHNFMIYFAMWAYAALAILYGIRHILSVLENGASHMALDIILSVLLIVVGIITIKARFDLAAFRAIAIKELLGTCIAAAVIFLLVTVVGALVIIFLLLTFFSLLSDAASYFISMYREIVYRLY